MNEASKKFLAERTALELELEHARHAYYTTGKSHLSDAEFDRKEEKLFGMGNKLAYFEQVGAKVKTGKVIQHQVPMLSMEKVKNIADLGHWLKRLPLEHSPLLIVQPKIDGLAVSVFYKDGGLVYVATRGDGHQGRDVTHIATEVADIPAEIELKGEIEIRGEIYLPKGSGIGNNTSLRNTAVDLVNIRKWEDRSELAQLRFAAYQCARVRLHRSEGQQIHLLRALGFPTVEYSILDTLAEVENFYQLYQQQLRQEWPYETDGLVICIDDSHLHDAIDSKWEVTHHHHYTIALKPPGEEARTTLRQIVWQVSKSGLLTPIAVLDQVLLSGVQVSQAMLFSYKMVEDFDLRLGDTLLVTRTLNDVTPRVLANLSQDGRQPLPDARYRITHCPSCKTKLVRKRIHLVCPYNECLERLVQSFLYLVKSLGIRGLGEETIRKLLENRIISSIDHLFTIEKEGLLQVKGLRAQDADNLLQEIERVRKRAKNYMPKKIWTQAICCTGTGPLPRKTLITLLEQQGFSYTDVINKQVQLLLCENLEGESSKLKQARKWGIPILSYQEYLTEDFLANPQEYLQRLRAQLKP